ncbi:16S rRNA (guanine(527)-N(7))-methyltransferase RsmG [Caldisalinibacter kiritimatiensis]|uniref:Ribosomal RNA small subunit methyltransferase G n=1 Tax=Caldisalinibacter kiritimatiensis TaxID=1304284 RepID=R1CL46_9FIRM|nr:16S rRNA (guanine(527)-N(7))-methyltransferase RsmG [Caldisalinibacter kiritimatiensis]EOC99425.1 rRNA small subunit methyltransferase, glucose inhibited division protein GidB [Caldisalinibacter kiritimatiensis]
MTNMNTLIEGLGELSIPLENEKIDKFAIYKELLKEWNKKINITAITDDSDIDVKHFIDSLSVLKTGFVKEGYKIIDIGTGGGFPGLPLKIANPSLEVVLLDSLNKRIKFLNEVIENLGLSNITVIHGRAEDYGKKEEYREKFDIAVSRAVASLNVLCEYCLPFVKVGGYFLAMKGPEIYEEIEDAKKALDVLGGVVEDKFDIKLPFTDIKHTILVIKKVTETPTKYPRKAGKPTKRPL